MSVLQPSGGNSISTKSEHPKLPIPRWGKPRAHDTHHHGGIEKRRVSHACEPCREKKTKCDGGRPLCHHCLVSGVECQYGDGKREKAKKNLRTLEDRIAVLEELIQETRPYLNSAAQYAVQKVLARSPSPSLIGSLRQQSTGTNSASSHNFSQWSPGNNPGGSLVSADMGSMRSLGHAVEDVNTSTTMCPSVYLGRTEETVLVHHAGKGLENAGHEAPASVFGLSHSHEAGTNSSFSLEDLDIPTPSQHVDMFSPPPRSVADKLINSYFITVHPLFPIIYKPYFMKQFTAYYNSLELPRLQSSRKWLTVLNLVFAIGGKYPKLELGVEGGDQGDVDYFIRSRILGALDGGFVLEIPDLEKVQALGLTGMYLIASVQTNRAWNVIGLAIRLAHGIGLHLRNNSPMGDMEKKMRLRIWYCLCSLETNLCLITGRPCAIQGRDCSAPCPSVLNDEIVPSGYSNDSTLDIYFSKHHGLTVISADVLQILYSARSPRDKGWSQVQDYIRELSTQLDQWRMGLPPELDFLGAEEADFMFKRQRLNLAFQYHTTRMLINRPCLCLFKGHTPNESSESREFSKQSAAACVGSARAIIHLIVDEPNPSNLVCNSPWWCLLHYLTPAKSILMLEITYQTVHTPGYKAGLFADGKMVLGWLRSASKMNSTLRRHSLEFADQLGKVAPRIEEQFENKRRMEGGEFKDISPDPPSPSTTDQASLQFRPEGELPFEVFGEYHNAQGQYSNLASPFVWWSSTQSDWDLTMADVSVVPYGRLQGHNPQVDIN